MRILVGWDNKAEAELISLYLSVDENEAVVTSDRTAFLQQAFSEKQWDIILMVTEMPNPEGAFEIFIKLHRFRPNVPIVGACHAPEVYRIVRFMTAGMRAYVMRDVGGDFVFMLQATLESTLEAVAAERDQKLAERLREEIESVRKLQESLIPAHVEAPEGYQIAARYEPSQIKVMGGRPVTMAGGDYYDVFYLDDNNLVLLVGDASGHGMKAAMSIMTMHTLVRMIRKQKYANTAAFVSEVNNQLSKQGIVNEEGGFITLLYVILRVDQEELQWTSAGHPVPMVQDRSNGEVNLLGPHDAGGLPLGIMPEVEYETYTSPLPKNSRLILLTDGLEDAFPEGKSGSHHQFGQSGIIQTLTETVTLTVHDALQALFEESSKFTEGSGRHDDTSVLILDRE